jgi:hypothetical protein
MDDSFFYFKLAKQHFICISPLSKGLLGEMNTDGLGDEFGYFVYESTENSPRGCTSILAKCESYESASRLIEIYKTAPTRKIAA